MAKEREQEGLETYSVQFDNISWNDDDISSQYIYARHAAGEPEFSMRPKRQLEYVDKQQNQAPQPTPL